MHDETRKTITAALHLVQQEVSLEANRVSRIRALIREYLSPPPPEKSPEPVPEEPVRSSPSFAVSPLTSSRLLGDTERTIILT